MAYSTIEQFRNNVLKLEQSGDYANLKVTDKIVQADSIIGQDLAGIVDFSVVPNIDDSPATPDFINLLSQFKVAEMSLVAKFGGKRDVDEVSDIQYWQKLYTELLEKIIDGLIALELSDGTGVGKGKQRFVREARKGAEPILGLGEYHEFLTSAEIADLYPEDK